MKRRAIALLAAAHLFDDVNQGVIPALIPFFVTERGFTIAAAAGLVLAANASSSVLQPLFGQIADRRSAPWLVPGGLLLAGTGVALTGLAPTYALALSAAAASGIGVAAFHPEASRQVHSLSGRRRALAMSLFAVGGNLGFALGPALATPLQIALGLRGTVLLAIPALTMAVVLVAAKRRAPGLEAAAPAAPETEDRWAPFARLTIAVSCRAIVFAGLNVFIPLYWIRVFGQSKAAGGAALSLMLFSGVVGTVAGGWLADRFGRRVVVFGSLAGLCPLLLAFVAASRPGLALAALLPIGIALSLPFSVMTVLGQEYLPGRVGTASGVTIGLAVTLGGLVAPLLGRFADLHGIRAAVWTIVFVPILGAAAALTLPRERLRTPEA
ncbi:MAG TPA: MFS transporter [Thermoanaerobaculia bacterium]|nr:MFS transporter [Thermoanaerobaculia bacterium]